MRNTQALLLLAVSGSIGCNASCEVRIQSSHADAGLPQVSQGHGQLDLYEEQGGAAGPVEVQLSMRMKKPFSKEFIHLLAQTIEKESESQGLDPMLVLAVIETESSFDPQAVSFKDAQGLMQLKRRTMEYEAHRTGLVNTDPTDPMANVQAGIRYLGRLRRAFRQTDVALIAYNAGPHRVWEWRHSEDGQIPEEFYTYPKTVLRKYRRYAHARSPESTTIAYR